MQRQLLPLNALGNEDRRDFIYLPDPDTVVPDGGIVGGKDRVFEIEDQFSAGACVANAGISSIESLQKHLGADHVHDGSRMFTYADGRIANGHEGSGMVVRWMWDSLRNNGVPSEADYPYDISKQDYEPPRSIYEKAEDHRVLRYEYVVPYSAFDPRFRKVFSHQEKVDRILAALVEGHVVVVGHPVTRDIFDLTGPWQEHNYRTTIGGVEPAGGHCYYIVGADIDKRKFLCVNSWGTDYADEGFMGMPFGIVDLALFEASICRQFLDEDETYEIKEDKKVVVTRKDYWRIHVEAVGYEGYNDIWVAALTPQGEWFVRETEGWYQMVPTPSGHPNNNYQDIFVPRSEVTRPTTTIETLGRTELAAISWLPVLNNPELAGTEIYMAIVPDGSDINSVDMSELHLLATLPIE